MPVILAGVSMFAIGDAGAYWFRSWSRSNSPPFLVLPYGFVPLDPRPARTARGTSTMRIVLVDSAEADRTPSGASLSKILRCSNRMIFPRVSVG
jgi:hypothetical protein